MSSESVIFSVYLMRFHLHFIRDSFHVSINLIILQCCYKIFFRFIIKMISFKDFCDSIATHPMRGLVNLPTVDQQLKRGRLEDAQKFQEWALWSSADTKPTSKLSVNVMGAIQMQCTMSNSQLIQKWDQEIERLSSVKVVNSSNMHPVSAHMNVSVIEQMALDLGMDLSLYPLRHFLENGYPIIGTHSPSGLFPKLLAKDLSERAFNEKKELYVLPESVPKTDIDPELLQHTLHAAKLKSPKKIEKWITDSPAQAFNRIQNLLTQPPPSEKWQDGEVLRAVEKGFLDGISEGRIQHISVNMSPDGPLGSDGIPVAAVIPSFGTRQSNKIRTITDFRGVNLFSTYVEKFCLPSTDEYAAMASLLVTGGAHEVDGNTAKDVNDQLRFAVQNRKEKRAKSQAQDADEVSQPPELVTYQGDEQAALNPKAERRFKKFDNSVTRRFCELQMFSTDYSKAYWQLPVAKDHLKYSCSLVFCPEGDLSKGVHPGWNLFRVKHCIFGSIASVAHWCTLAEIVSQWLNLKMGIPNRIYVDDAAYFSFLPHIALEKVLHICRLTGIRVSFEKVGIGYSLDIIGRNLRLDNGILHVATLSKTVAKAKVAVLQFKKMVCDALECQYIVPVAVDALVDVCQSAVGSVSYSTLVAYTHVVKAVLTPLYALITKSDQATRSKLRSIYFGMIMRILDNNSFAAIPLCSPGALIVTKSDASLAEGEARIGVEVNTPDTIYVCECLVPEDLKSCGINILEIIAAILGSVITIAVMPSGTCHCVSFIDNSTALFALSKSMSRSPKLRSLAATDRQIQCSSRSNQTRLRYITSEQNSSDGLTRQDLFNHMVEYLRIQRDTHARSIQWVVLDFDSVFDIVRDNLNRVEDLHAYHEFAARWLSLNISFEPLL